MFSFRTNWSSDINPLMSCLEALKAQKVEIFDLTESNPTRAGFRYPKQILKPFSRSHNLLYSPESFGDQKAREAVCQMYARQGISVEPSHVILTASSSEAYSFLFRLLLDPGDAVLFPQPSYPLFDFLAQLNDAQMDFYPLAYEGRWKIEKEGFQQAITSKTKVVTLVSPNNPTGCFVKPEELVFVNQACRKNDMAIICDEVFLDYVSVEEKANAKSLAGNSSVLTFTLGGLSKSLGLPQMKVSWIIVSGPKDQVSDALKRLEIIADTYLSVNTPCQNALGEWILLKDKIQQQIKARIEKNKKVLGAFCQKAPFTLLHSDGGWYGILELPPGACEETWSLDLLQKHHVFVHPGYFFDFHEGAHLILSYLTPENIFREGLQRIGDYSLPCKVI